jgi:transcription antitermination protein NusB
VRGRRAARRLAVEVLYEATIRNGSPAAALRAREADGWVIPEDDDREHPEGDDRPDPETLAYARRLVRGVEGHRPGIDDWIVSTTASWDIDRMPVIDATVLRVAIYELLWEEDVPVAVVINEAIEIAKTLSTEESGRFVNGLLGRIAEQRSVRDTSC